MSTQTDHPHNSISAESIAKQIREMLAERGLSPALAKLYSQHTRLSTNQPGLTGWRSEEIWLRLHDALRLTACGLLEKEINVEGWINSLRRAGELLEWLSHSELNPEDLPLLLMASAVYQLAGYPARSTGLLNQTQLSDEQSRILYYFLKADFKNLLQELTQYWSIQDSTFNPAPLPWDNQEALSSAIHRWITAETASAFGILCAYMRWGENQRMNAAIQKLAAIADVFLHAKDPFSWLIAKLCAEIASTYFNTALRNNLLSLNPSISPQGVDALEYYVRQGYLTGRALAWPSQAKGIEQLSHQASFVLCTPTGSGKTTIAEVAILQSLFPKEPESLSLSNSAEDLRAMKGIALYLVPSRALATEVEAKLSRVLGQVSNERMIVTGLYGGNDWGATDAWLTADDRTILICTYEKAEALMRFLGPLFLHKVSLIVIDEAHNILFDGELEKLKRGESRALRLEALCTRLLTFLEEYNSRVIALSAVTAGAEDILSHWITGSSTALPITTPYRSTRQLIGSLECAASGHTEIRYDLLDNANLQFQEQGHSDAPYIPNPFPQCPIPTKWQKQGAEKRTRPQLFWAALHLAQSGTGERLRSVLISTPQHIGNYADDFLELLDGPWKDIDLPKFFHPPTERRKLQLWQHALASCEDYFTNDSREYQLLEKGIVVHHGKMPGLLARLLVQLIEERIVSLVLATSTLSEGVNLPFETILIPSLLRAKESITVSEFANLVGRAGRPGFGTEGRSLVVLPKLHLGDAKQREVNNARRRYVELINRMQQRSSISQNTNATDVRSPLAELLIQLQIQWQRIAHSTSPQEFMAWLERTIPLNEQAIKATRGQDDADVQLLDSLDAILLAAIVELEQIANQNLALDVLEEKLQQIWRRSYAYYASQNEQNLQAIFTQRGLALRQHIYPDKAQRKRLYCTSLPPISGTQLLLVYSELLDHLKTGADYAEWPAEQKFGYISEIVDQLGKVQQFALDEKAGRSAVDWRNILRWWLDPSTATINPSRTEVSNWHAYVSRVFQYRINWGIGSLIALAIDEAYPGQLRSSSLQDWSQTQLPWVIFWLKELIVWGTLDPVVAYLLSHKLEITRANAIQTAQQYYHIYEMVEPNERLNATNIRNWARSLRQSAPENRPERWNNRIYVELLRDFKGQAQKQWRVVPVVYEDQIKWLDPAGFPLANSIKPKDWVLDDLHYFDFLLDPLQKLVTSQPYT